MDKTDLLLWQRNEVTREMAVEFRKQYERDRRYLEEAAHPDEYRRFQGRCDVYRKVLEWIDAKTG